MLRVQDVMTRGIERVEATTPAEDAWRQMRARGVHHLVVFSGGLLVGVFSDRDAGGLRGTAARSGRTVGDLMTAKPVTVRPDVPVRKAANLMRGRSIGSVIVTDARERPLGIVTVSDLLELLGRGMQHPTMATGARASLSHRVPHRKRAGATGVW